MEVSCKTPTLALISGAARDGAREVFPRVRDGATLAESRLQLDLLFNQALRQNIFGLLALRGFEAILLRTASQHVDLHEPHVMSSVYEEVDAQSLEVRRSRVRYGRRRGKQCSKHATYDCASLRKYVSVVKVLTPAGGLQVSRIVGNRPIPLESPLAPPQICDVARNAEGDGELLGREVDVRVPVQPHGRRACHVGQHPQAEVILVHARRAPRDCCEGLTKARTRCNVVDDASADAVGDAVGDALGEAALSHTGRFILKATADSVARMWANAALIPEL
mmetsp:Transcript_39005/g.107401  ORF Transcript_39005/g.107401 Transcript_39005/m.107401 type:complete len:278 (+) Transcript_39005:150-983(+)